jgi:pimeloyl-ACP methyl ester carboxylesterase
MARFELSVQTLGGAAAGELAGGAAKGVRVRTLVVKVAGEAGVSAAEATALARFVTKVRSSELRLSAAAYGKGALNALADGLEEANNDALLRASVRDTSRESGQQERRHRRVERLLDRNRTLADEIAAWKKAFLATSASWERRALVLQLDPTVQVGRDLLCRFVLYTQDWYLREAAIDVLAGALREGDPEPLLAQLRGYDSPLVDEAIPLALARTGRRRHFARVRGFLEHDGFVVRGAACRALAAYPDWRSVEALVGLYERGDRAEVCSELVAVLRRLTGQRDLVGPEAWRAWWDRAKPDFKPASEDVDVRPPARTDVFAGVQLTYRQRGVDAGMPLLVLPDFGYESSYLEATLSEVERERRVLYVTLPAAADFRAPTLGSGGGLPTYPLERVVAAVEALRAKLLADGSIGERFALFAHGRSAWIAMAYVSEHPKAVRRLVLVAAHSGTKAAAQGVADLEQRGKEIGDEELLHYAQSRRVSAGVAAYSPKSPEEEEALDRVSFRARFADPRDLRIGRLLGGVEEREGGRMHRLLRPLGCALPTFSLFELPVAPVPTLIFHGGFSVETSAQDAEAIKRHFGKNARVITFKRSAELPFMEEAAKTVAGMRRFLGVKTRKR